MGQHDQQHDQQGQGQHDKQGQQGQGQGQAGGMSQGSDMPYGGSDATTGDATKSDQGGWNDRSQREMERGDATSPATPEGTTPLERSERPINQSR